MVSVAVLVTPLAVVEVRVAEAATMPPLPATVREPFMDTDQGP